MTRTQLLLTTVMLNVALGLQPALAQDEMATFRTWAMTPPMGWNSWDCYYSSVTEKEVLQNAQYLVDNDLVKYGWEYVVVDIRWYCNHPSLGGGNYNQNGTQDYVLDEYGRYLPSPSRFPSCMVNGKNEGFKALADRIHSMGLKFGIHIMRGVPKSVVGSSFKLKGSEGTAWSEVYNGTTSPCTWLKDNLLVRNNDAGQLYYNSIMDLYAEWGVDFLKIDDLSRPFYTDEIHMIRKAIDQTNRPIVLSLSPGKTQYQYAQECLNNANMWRMMDDLWDTWSAVDAVFNEADVWSQYSRPGNYADCDMLPLGQIAMTVGDTGYTSAQSGRWTRLTQNEQLTMMSLWGICHSPLFFGGEMTRNDAFTLSLLNNEEYHQMHKYGEEAHQVFNDDDLGRVAWTSHIDNTRYLALFQRDNTRWVVGQKALYKSETVAYTTDGHAVDVNIEWPEGEKTLVLVIDDGGDNYNYDHADWINPTLVLRNGTEVPLTGEYKTRDYTKSYFNRVYENKNVQTGGKMTVMGVTYDRGFSADANAAIFFQIPDDMDVVRFKAMAAADDSGINQTNATTSVRFMVFAQNPLTNEQDESATRSGLISRQGTKSMMMECDVTDGKQLKIVVSNWNDGFSYDRADLINPVLIDDEGNETSLTSLTYTSYKSDWGSLHVNQNVEGRSLVVEGQTYTTGLGMNAQCTLIYDLPAGHNYKTFRALCGYDSSCDTDNTSTSGTTMEFLFYVTKNDLYTFDLTLLGYAANEAVSVHDIWTGEDMETVMGELTTSVPSHGVKLFRLGDKASIEVIKKEAYPTTIDLSDIDVVGEKELTIDYYPVNDGWATHTQSGMPVDNVPAVLDLPISNFKLDMMYVKSDASTLSRTKCASGGNGFWLIKENMEAGELFCTADDYDANRRVFLNVDGFYQTNQTVKIGYGQRPNSCQTGVYETGVYMLTPRGENDRWKAYHVILKFNLQGSLINEDADYAPEANGITAITLKRTIGADKWSTLVLPVALTETQLKGAFGDNVRIAALSSATAEELQFTSVTSTKANQPYMIYLDEPFTETTIDGVSINVETPRQDVAGASFIGSYAAVTGIPTDAYFVKDNYLLQAGTGCTMKGTRAYFTVPEAASVSARGLNIILDGTNTTGITNLESNVPRDGNWYNLQGQRVNVPRKGVFIRNGKKVLIRRIGYLGEY